MNILLYDYNSFIQKDLIFFLEKAGHKCRNIKYKFPNSFEDDFFEWKFSKIIEEDKYDCVISTNFYPLVAKCAYRYNLKYLAWTYDSPFDERFFKYIEYPTNFIFFFDREDTLMVRNRGFNNAFHLPLAVNTDRLDKIVPNREEKKLYSSDISFIGQFYENPLYNIKNCISDYDKGYIDSIIKNQEKIYGTNFIDNVLNDDVLNRVSKAFCEKTGYQITRWGLVNSITRELAREERILLCGVMAKHHNLKYYSGSAPEELSHIPWTGTAFYFTSMPMIFKLSKINLCPVLRSIKSGIPLRAIDILGCGGLLFASYQPEIAEYFENGKDVVMYESIDDAIAKADFYLSHSDLRRQIANNGYLKVKEYFTYEDRISAILKTAEF